MNCGTPECSQLIFSAGESPEGTYNIIIIIALDFKRYQLHLKLYLEPDFEVAYSRILLGLSGGNLAEFLNGFGDNLP